MIQLDELEIEVYEDPRLGMANRNMTGVKITHTPSMTIAMCNKTRSQRKNREIAISMIEDALKAKEN